MSDTAQWVTLLTVIAGFMYQAWRENRQRRWDKEDRAETAERLARKVEHTTEAISSRHAENTRMLADKIDENTDISTKAFHEANSVNLKIESIGLEHNRLQRDEQAHRRRSTDER